MTAERDAAEADKRDLQARVQELSGELEEKVITSFPSFFYSILFLSSFSGSLNSIIGSCFGDSYRPEEGRR